MTYGLHVSAAGGIANAPARARKEGGDCLQLFLSSPRTWKLKDYTEKDAKSYKSVCKEHSIQASFAHEMYLTSYGTPNDEHRNKSINALNHSLKSCDLLGIRGVVTHLGSRKGEGFESVLQRTADAILEALQGSNHSYAILEISAGSGGNVGNSIEELAAIYEAADRHARIKFCLDTAHLLGAGYEIRTKEGFDKVLQKFDDLIGLEHLVVMHLNDSKVDINSKKDRHENIGDGFIGKEGFKVILNHPKLKDVPGILEVPGIKGDGPDKENIERLKELTE